MMLKISEKEVEDAINELSVGKAPGSDGLIASFYKYFCEKVMLILIAVFNHAFEDRELSLSQCLAIIVLLFKKGSKELLVNYRPISLTNTDYKILANVLTARLTLHLPDLISPQQTAYMKGTNIRSVQDMIDYSESCQDDIAILFLDFKKAFDLVSHLFFGETSVAHWSSSSLC